MRIFARITTYCAFTREVATSCGGGTAVKGTLPFGEGVGVRFLASLSRKRNSPCQLSRWIEMVKVVTMIW
jgi:hypothetical protein